MHAFKEISSKYIPEKLQKLEKLTRQIENLQLKLDELSEDIFMDIIDGWSTGDKILDFALVACDGLYDPFVICMQYRKLHEIGLRTPNQRIIIIQKSEYYPEDEEPVILRNVYLATLRSKEVHFEINTLSIHLPVEPKYFVWREFIHKGFLTNGYKIVDQNWIKVGALHNQYCNYGMCYQDGESFYVPEDGVCDIEFFPIKDKGSLFLDYGIDTETLDYLHKQWFKAKTKKFLQNNK